MYIDPEYMYEPEDLPPEYEEEEEEEGPDYEIIEEDRINEALDKLNIPNYDEVEMHLVQEGINDGKKKIYINENLEKADTNGNNSLGFRLKLPKN